MGGASAPPSDVAVQKTLSARAAFGRRKPARHGRGAIRKRARFSRAKQKPHSEQQPEIRHRSGQRREGRPPEHDARQDSARADPVAQHSAGDFKQRVRQSERADYPAPVARADAHFALHPGPSDGDAQAVEIHHEHHREQQGQDAEAIRHEVYMIGSPR